MVGMDKEDSEENDVTIRSDDTFMGYDHNRDAAAAADKSPVAALRSRRQIHLEHSTNSIDRRSTCIRKLAEKEHFHYKNVELGPVSVRLVSGKFDAPIDQLTLEVESNDTTWLIHRNFHQLCAFDCQLHRCVFDRSHSKLCELGEVTVKGELLRIIIEKYLVRLSQLTGSLIKCFPVLRFLEVDSKGNRFLPAEETAINTPAIATAIVTKDYKARSSDQISLKVGDIVSIIEKAPPQSDGSCWWKAKLTIAKGTDDDDIGSRYKVGLFPRDCVKVFDGKSELSNGTANINKPQQKRVVRPRERSLMRVFLKRNPPSSTIPVFGTDLVEYLQRTGQDVPLILKKCVEVIERYGVVTGVYRQCGIQSNVQKLRNAFDCGLISEAFNENILRDVHCVSSLLKQYFRQLPNPLFTFALYSQFIVAYETRDETRPDKFKSVIDKLPAEHYRTAKYLIRHLSKLCQCAQLTDMNSKNLAIVWAPNLFRPPPCQNGSDIYSLQGLNVQTGLCNYIILHAVYLFSLDTEPLPILDNEKYKKPINTERHKHTDSPDLKQQKYIEVNGGPLSLPSYHTILDRPVRKTYEPQKPWKKILNGPQSENAFSTLKNRWKSSGESHTYDSPSPEDVKWRRSLSPENAEMRTTRSTSLITFVAKSVEEFRNGVFHGWRARNGNKRNVSETLNIPKEVVIRNSMNSAARKLRRQHATTTMNFDAIPSTSAELRELCDRRGSVSEASTSTQTDSDDLHRRAVRRLSRLTESYSLHDAETPKAITTANSSPMPSEKQYQFLRDSQGDVFRSSTRSDRHVAFECGPPKASVEDITKTTTTPTSASSSLRSSGSEESLQLDISRYDNVSPQAKNATESRLRLAETPLSFYDLPQETASKPCQTNVQFYYL